MNGEQSPGWYFAHPQDDLNLSISGMHDGTFSPGATHMILDTFFIKTKKSKRKTGTYTPYWAIRENIQRKIIGFIINFICFISATHLAFIIAATKYITSNQKSDTACCQMRQRFGRSILPAKMVSLRKFSWKSSNLLKVNTWTQEL